MPTVISGDTGIDKVQDGAIGTADLADGAVTPAKTQMGATPSMVRVQSANGYGSTNTCIKRYSNVLTNQGSDITYADSATLGASFTINTSGVYSITLVVNGPINQLFGASLNTTQAATSLGSITAADRIVMGAVYGGGATASASVALYLASGSVIRPHSDAGATGSAVTEQFTISRVA